MTVTVVIPTYRAAAFVRRTLDSVAAQTRPPLEVVVADDCSPDGTVAAVAAWSATAPFPVRVVRLPRNTGGPAAPLNAGIAAARGRLIALLDHDDEMDTHKLERQAAVLTATSGVGLVFHRCTPVGCMNSSGFDDYLKRVDTWIAQTVRGRPTNDSVLVSRLDAYTGLVNLNYALTCSAMLFPKVVWRKAGGFDTSFRAKCDYAFLLSVTARWDIAVVDRPLVRWNRRPESLTNHTEQIREAVESWRLLNRFRPRLLQSAASRRDLEGQLCDQADWLFDTAYRLRESGHPAEALRIYRTLLRHKPRMSYLKAAAKTIIRLVPTRGR